MRKFSTKRLVEIDDQTYPLANCTVAWMEALDEIDKLRPDDREGDGDPTADETLADAKALMAWTESLIMHCIPTFGEATLPELGLPIKMELAANLNALVREVDLDRHNNGGPDIPPASPDGKD